VFIYYSAYPNAFHTSIDVEVMVREVACTPYNAEVQHAALLLDLNQKHR
jgi:hypothetical protein